MTNKKNPNEKQPGENPDDRYHFNPGIWQGKRRRMRSRPTKIAALRMITRKSPPVRTCR